MDKLYRKTTWTHYNQFIVFQFGPGLEQLEDSTKATGDCVWQGCPLVMTNMALENHRFHGEIHELNGDFPELFITRG